nr:acetylornithine deacetylase [Sphingomonas sp. Y57]
MAGEDQAPSDATVDWVRRLIGFDTTSRRSNRALIDSAAEHLGAQGCHLTLTTTDDGAKANLFATLAPPSGQRTGGLVLSGHTDVVPVDGQAWTSAPFKAVLRDGRLYGRGSCDMKGFLGVTLALVPAFRGMALTEPVHFALSFDEEVGCVGAPLMIADLAARAVRPRACIVGEPTLMQPVIGHKAIRLFRCRVHGRPAHASLPHEGANAIEFAARIMVFIRSLADSLGSKPRCHDFHPPYTTMSIGQVSGGTAANIVAEHCEFLFEYRSLPEEDDDRIEQAIRAFISHEILPEMRAAYSRADVALERLATVPAFAADAREPFTHLVEELTGAAAGYVSYCSEAGQFSDIGIPTVICGPGSIEQAHRADEWIALDQLAACERFLIDAVDRVCGAPRHG